MANNTYTRAGGVWATDTDLLSAEMADIDAKTVRSISGTGGAYFLDDDMVWTGAASSVFDVGVETIFRADVTCENDTFLNGPVYVYGTSGFFAPVAFSAETEFNDDVTANNDFFLLGPAYVYGQIGFYSASFFEAGSDPEFNAPVEFNGSVTMNGGPFITNVVTILGDSTHAVQLRGPTQLSNSLTTTGTGAIIQRSVIGANGNASYSPRSAHEVVILSGGISGPVDYTIDDTGAVDDMEILFTNKDQTHTMTVKKPGGTGIVGVSGGWVRCKRILGTWYGVQRGDITIS